MTSEVSERNPKDPERLAILFGLTEQYFLKPYVFHLVAYSTLNIREEMPVYRSYLYIMINFIWLHVSTRNESSSGHLNLLLWPNSYYKLNVSWSMTERMFSQVHHLNYNAKLIYYYLKITTGRHVSTFNESSSGSRNLRTFTIECYIWCGQLILPVILDIICAHLDGTRKNKC
jgi:hypothetical protein